MAEVLRVYRRFYHVGIAADLSSTYTLIDPYSLATTVRNVSQGNIVVESSASTVYVSTGVYYADLISSLYNTDDEYEIDWQTRYIDIAPIKSLYTRFQFPYVIDPGGGVIRELDVELINEIPLKLEVTTHSIDYTIEPNTP